MGITKSHWIYLWVLLFIPLKIGTGLRILKLFEFEFGKEKIRPRPPHPIVMPWSLIICFIISIYTVIRVEKRTSRFV
jgi:hypothetical protein